MQEELEGDREEWGLILNLKAAYRKLVSMKNVLYHFKIKHKIINFFIIRTFILSIHF